MMIEKINQKPIASLSLDLDNQWSYRKIHGDRGWETLALDGQVLRGSYLLETDNPSGESPFCDNSSYCLFSRKRVNLTTL